MQSATNTPSCLTLDAKNYLANLEMLISQNPAEQQSLDLLKISHHGMALTWLINYDKMLQILQHAITLQVKHLKLRNLNFGLAETIDGVALKTIRQQLRHAKLRKLTFKGCDNSADILHDILAADNNITSLVIRNCNLNLEKLSRLSHWLETNYKLYEIDLSYKTNSQYDPFKTTFQIARRTSREKFSICIHRLKAITDRNQTMHDNCLKAIMLILLAQTSKSTERNGFTFIGRDCTRIIARYVYTTKFCLGWIRQ